jgi:hypothetical protein
MKLLRQILLNFFSRNNYIFIAGIIAYLKNPKKSFSQYGEDLIIHQYFKAIDLFNEGVYIDIGAYHPKWISNTYLLSKYGWKGFVVDVDSAKLNLFKNFRKNCITICAAIAPGKSDQSINIYNFKKLFSEIDTLDENIAIQNKKRFNCDFIINKITTLNVNDLLDNCYKVHGKCDFINIDIEGLDDLVLKEINFNKFKPKLICFEKNNIININTDPIAIFLNNQNYFHLFSSNGSHAFVLN